MPRTLGRALLAAAAACLPLLLPAAGHAAWGAYPWLTVSGGYESRWLYDDTRVRGVPQDSVSVSGALVGLTPGLRLSGPLAERVRLDLSGQLGYERFDEATERAVLGAAVGADLRVRMGRSWFWRASAAGNRYTDSAYETADRVGGGVETGFGLTDVDWALEAVGGMDGRRYQNFVSADDEGLLGTYTETGVFVGLTGWARATSGELFSARVVGQRTDARDPLYDSDSWLAQLSTRAELGSGVFLTVSALGQMRRFSARPDREAEDSYWQVGVGLDRAVAEAVRVTGRYAFGRVNDPLGVSENLHRATLAVTWGLGQTPGFGGDPVLSLPRGLMAEPLHENESRLFRCHAPDASEVSLVGDFNGWDPTAHPLRRASDGWWRLELRLPAGTYLYAYLVDGRPVTPADAEVVVDDGFGGKNGLIRVQGEEP